MREMLVDCYYDEKIATFHRLIRVSVNKLVIGDHQRANNKYAGTDGRSETNL